MEPDIGDTLVARGDFFMYGHGEQFLTQDKHYEVLGVEPSPNGNRLWITDDVGHKHYFPINTIKNESNWLEFFYPFEVEETLTDYILNQLNKNYDVQKINQ